MASLVAVVALLVVPSSSPKADMSSLMTYSCLAGLVLAFGSNLPDFLLHSKDMLICFLTYVKFQATHVLSIQFFNSVLSVSFVVVLDESERAL